MKRQTQQRGARAWAGDDLVDLQSEPLKAIDAIFSPYPACIVSGCEITPNGSKFNISDGFVSLKGKNHENEQVSAVVPFVSVQNTTLPIYLTLKYEAINDVYGDGGLKPIAYNYTALASTVRPTISYLEISTTAKVKFTDVIQDNNHLFLTTPERDKLTNIAANANNYVHPDDTSTRHVTDSEKSTWNNKATTSVATTSQNGLMSSDDKKKLNDIEANANNYTHPTDSNSLHMTQSEKTKLSGIATNANNYVHPDTASTRHVTDSEKSTWNNKLNKPIIAIIGSDGGYFPDTPHDDRILSIKFDRQQDVYTITVKGNFTIPAIVISPFSPVQHIFSCEPGPQPNTLDIHVSFLDMSTVNFSMILFV